MCKRAIFPALCSHLVDWLHSNLFRLLQAFFCVLNSRCIDFANDHDGQTTEPFFLVTRYAETAVKCNAVREYDLSILSRSSRSLRSNGRMNANMWRRIASNGLWRKRKKSFSWSTYDFLCLVLTAMRILIPVAGFFKVVPGIENRVSGIREIRPLQVHTGYLTFSLKKALLVVTAEMGAAIWW